jgi:orotidine-5'-phosphate decarboxylase
MTKPHEHIAFALDVPDANTAENFIRTLEPYVGAFKVGLELFIKTGRTFMELTVNPIILDLKLHDIPETVERAVKTGGDRGVKFMTIHAQQRKALEKAIKAAEPFGITLLMVTVLTSMSDEDYKELDFNPKNKIQSRVGSLGAFGYDCGIRGFVCSPHEVGSLSQVMPEAFYLVPGVRSAGANVGDQKRVGSPGQAVHDGANLIVVGRQIRDSNAPQIEAQVIAEEIRSSLDWDKVTT